MKEEKITRKSEGKRSVKAAALFQILLIISLEFIIPLSYKSYLQSTSLLSSPESGKKDSWLNEKLALLKELYTEALPTVSAQGPPQLYCCERTQGGAICQTSSQDQCNPQFRSAPGRCEDNVLATCVLGCCIRNGVASENTPAVSCQQAGGDFFAP